MNILATLDSLEKRAQKLPGEIDSLANRLDKHTFNCAASQVMAQHTRHMALLLMFVGRSLPVGSLTPQIAVSRRNIMTVWIVGIANQAGRDPLEVAFELWLRGYSIFSLEGYEKFCQEIARVLRFSMGENFL